MEEEENNVAEDLEQLDRIKQRDLIMDRPFMRPLIAVSFVIVLLVVAARWSFRAPNTHGGAGITRVGQSTSTTASGGETARSSGTSRSAAQSIDIKNGAIIVRYTSGGFTPFITEVKDGGAVEFVNDSDKPLWVTTKGHPTAKNQDYPAFDSGRSLKHGETFVFTFTKEGAWGYLNLDDPKHLGTIVVTPP